MMNAATAICIWNFGFASDTENQGGVSFERVDCHCVIIRLAAHSHLGVWHFAAERLGVDLLARGDDFGAEGEVDFAN